MTTAIANIESVKVPAFLRAPEGSVTNALAALATGTFPFLSIKGKRFAIVRNKEEKIIMRPDDEETPASAIEVVIVGSATNFAKVYYANGYTDGSKDKPTCFSNDGQSPDAQATDRQAKKCAVCPHNAWGSGSNGKGKACSDSLRLALAKPDELNDPMLLRVPPASLKAITEYASLLARKGVALEGVVTKIKFIASEATPKLEFSAVRYADQSSYNEALEISKSQIVQQIVGSSAAITPQMPTASDEDDEPAPAKAPSAQADADDEPAPPKKPQAKKPVATATASDVAAKLRASMDDADDD